MKKTESYDQLLKRFQKRVPELQERLRELREVVIPNLIEEEQWLESELTRTESCLYNITRNT